MSDCIPKFDSVINFDCVRDIIADVRAGTVSTASIQKGLWVVGSVLNVFTKAPVIAALDDDKTSLQIANELESLLDSTPIVAQGTGSGQPVSLSIDPALIFQIIQLIIKLLQNK